MKCQKCPICQGTGNVPGGFYTSVAEANTVSSSAVEQCKNCKGEGVLYFDEAASQQAPRLTGFEQGTDMSKLYNNCIKMAAITEFIEEFKEEFPKPNHGILGYVEVLKFLNDKVEKLIPGAGKE